MLDEHVGRLIGTGYRSVENNIHQVLTELEKDLEFVKARIDEVIQERCTKCYKIEEGLKQQGINPKVSHGDHIYALTEEAERLYNQFKSELNSIDRLNKVLSRPDLFIVINYDEAYLKYLEKLKYKV